MWGQGHMPPVGNRFVPIRRDQLLYDGFDQLNALGEGLKGRVRVQFIDPHGMVEAGVDGGGLFKEFIESIMQAGFNPQYGLFAASPDNRLYPNPAAFKVSTKAGGWGRQGAPRLHHVGAFDGRPGRSGCWRQRLCDLPAFVASGLPACAFLYTP